MTMADFGDVFRIIIAVAAFIGLVWYIRGH